MSHFLEYLAATREAMLQQDNRATEHPMYIVQQERAPGEWRFVSVFFTNDAAREFIQRNNHNLEKPRIYIASGYNNPEWKLVRGFLRGDGKDV